MYDQIIVTGSSISTGLESIDYKLRNIDKVSNLLVKEKDVIKKRNLSILDWYKNNFKISSKSFTKMFHDAMQEWCKLERENSWPTLLQKSTGITVHNLAETGGSIGRSLVEFSKFIESNPNLKETKTIAIHQLPPIGRLYLLFNKDKRVNILPTDSYNNMSIGYSKIFFSEQIKDVLDRRKKLYAKINYLENQYKKIILRLEWLAEKHNITNFYIFYNKEQIIPQIQNRVLIEDTSELLKKYDRGVLGHPIGEKFSQEIIGICKTIL